MKNKRKLALTLSFCMVILLMQAVHAVPPTDIENIIRDISEENVEIIISNLIDYLESIQVPDSDPLPE